MGESKAAAPGAAVEFAQQRFVGVVAGVCEVFGGDHQVAIGGLLTVDDMGQRGSCSCKRPALIGNRVKSEAAIPLDSECPREGNDEWHKPESTDLPDKSI